MSSTLRSGFGPALELLEVRLPENLVGLTNALSHRALAVLRSNEVSRDDESVKSLKVVLYGEPSPESLPKKRLSSLHVYLGG